MALAKLVQGDEVIVTAGKDKGKRGTVLKVLKRANKVLVEGVNQVSHFVRANPQENEQGGIQKREAPIAISNVQVFNPNTNRGERVGIKTLADGKRVRYFKQSKEEILTQDQG